MLKTSLKPDSHIKVSSLFLLFPLITSPLTLKLKVHIYLFFAILSVLWSYYMGTSIEHLQTLIV